MGNYGDGNNTRTVRTSMYSSNWKPSLSGLGRFFDTKRDGNEGAPRTPGGHTGGTGEAGGEPILACSINDTQSLPAYQELVWARSVATQKYGHLVEESRRLHRELLHFVVPKQWVGLILDGFPETSSVPEDQHGMVYKEVLRRIRFARRHIKGLEDIEAHWREQCSKGNGPYTTTEIIDTQEVS